MRSLFLLSISFFLAFVVKAQVGIGTATPNSTLDVRGSFSAGYRSFTTATSISITDLTVVFTGTTATTATLPTAIGCLGRMYSVKNASATLPTPVLTIGTTSAQTIDGKTTWLLDEPNETVMLVSTNANWIIIDQNVAVAKTTTTGGAWNQGGNRVTAMKTLGPITNFDLPFITNNTEKMRISATGNVGIGTSAFNAANPEKLLIDAGVTNSFNLTNATGTIDNYLQFNIQNKSAGTSASSDFVATADNGDETDNYMDMGINGSGYNGGIMGNANDSYLYNQGQNLLIAAGSHGKSLIFMTDGISLVTDEKMRITDKGDVGIGTTSPTAKLHIIGGNKNPLLLKNVPAGTPDDNVLTINNASGVVGTQSASSVFGGTAWSLSGNAALSTNFLGTTNTNPLVFKVNNIQSGYIGNLTSENVGLGYNESLGTALKSVAIGASAATTGNNATAVGYATRAGLQSVAIGFDADAIPGADPLESGATAVGYNAQATRNQATALGYNATAGTNINTTAIGASSIATGSLATTLGFSSSATGSNSLALGSSSIASATQSTAVGSTADATSSGATALGYNAQAVRDQATAIGFNATASTNNATTAIGSSSTATGLSATALGNSVSATGSNSLALGSSSIASATQSTAVGSTADATSSGATALGYNAQAVRDQATAIGFNATASTNNATTAIGSSSTATGLSATALGNSASATGSNSTAIGNGATTSQTNAFILGNSSVNVGIGTSTPLYKLQVNATSNPLFLAGVQTGSASDSLLTIINGVVKKITANSSLWTLLGNSGTNSGTNFLGTTDAIDFVTKTNNIERMRITSGGIVGIGTTSPTAGSSLDVKGHVALSNNGTASELRFYEPSAGGTNYTGFKAQAQAATVTYTLPAADGGNSQLLTTNGSGTLSWSNGGNLSYGITPVLNDESGALGGIWTFLNEVAVPVNLGDILVKDAYLSALFSANESGIRVTRSTTSGLGLVGTVVAYSFESLPGGSKYHVSTTVSRETGVAAGTWYYKLWVMGIHTAGTQNYNMVITKTQ